MELYTHEGVKHAKPVRCPWCGKPAPTLLFDSFSTWMVCGRCHSALMLARLEHVTAARHGRETMQRGI